MPKGGGMIPSQGPRGQLATWGQATSTARPIKSWSGGIPVRWRRKMDPITDEYVCLNFHMHICIYGMGIVEGPTTISESTMAVRVVGCLGSGKGF